MRIISGSAKGRRLLSPPGQGQRALVRPTSDRVREALFNIIASSIQGATVLDLFAGTGALGLEALSRGAADAVFVDNNRGVLDLIHKNVTLCGFSERSQLVQRDLTKSLFFLNRLAPPHGFDFIFIDPPYRHGFGARVLAELEISTVVSRDSLIIVEEANGIELPERIGRLRLTDSRRYGDTMIRFYLVGEDEQMLHLHES